MPSKGAVQVARRGRTETTCARVQPPGFTRGARRRASPPRMPRTGSKGPIGDHDKQWWSVAATSSLYGCRADFLADARCDGWGRPLADAPCALPGDSWGRSSLDAMPALWLMPEADNNLGPNAAANRFLACA